MRFLVTGCAGFIGSTLVDSLLADGHEVVGVDCFTTYYDPATKRANLAAALEHPSFSLHELDLARDHLSADLLQVDGVFHLAAQAGVRASWGSEFAVYTDCNVLATQRLLEAVVAATPAGGAPARVVYASSSSIYGNALDRPTREDALPAPVSPYGVTKLAAEHLGLTYHHNFAVPFVSLRFFTVYGERQRPDMAFHRFSRSMLLGEPIVVYGDGSQSRDFTYVGDIVAAARAAMQSDVAHDAFNLGGGTTITVREVLELLERITGRLGNIDWRERQKGDVRHTSADTSRARAALGFAPAVDLETGLRREVDWVASQLG